MIYTCYEMMRDCRADRPEGWRYFISNYVPVIRKILSHYAPNAGAPAVEQTLVSARQPEESLFQSSAPAPERWFVAALRQKVLRELPLPAVEIALDLASVAEAYEPFTVLEKQAAWMETMGYDAAAAGAMLRVSPQTVEKIRTRAAEMLRGKVDSWQAGIAAANGLALGREAAAASTPECPPAKEFLDILDGRTTWGNRETLERHVRSCWHCIDHFARMAEVIALIRDIAPLGEAEAEPFYRLLGVAAERKSFWRR